MIPLKTNCNCNSLANHLFSMFKLLFMCGPLNTYIHSYALDVKMIEIWLEPMLHFIAHRYHQFYFEVLFYQSQ